MKRRKFLSLLGAGVTAPALPSVSVAGANPLYSRTMFSRAVMHARLRHHVSARGIAYRLKVSRTQAEAMIAEMAKRGLVKPVVGGAGVHVRAMSAIVEPAPWAKAAQRARNTRTDARKPRAKGTMRQSEARDMALMPYLQALSEIRGLTLSPRCALYTGGMV